MKIAQVGLKIIQHLNEQKIITLSREKTNSHYIDELKKDAQLAENFLQLVNIYNTVWYGIHEIDQQHYFTHQKKFVTFLHSHDVKK